MSTILKGTFSTHDQKGRPRQIRELAKVTNTGHLGGYAQIEGMKQLQTESGQVVTPLGNGKYKIVVTNEILVADDYSPN